MVEKIETDNQAQGLPTNRDVMLRWFEEVLNDHRIETIDELMSPDFVGHYEHGEIRGRDQWKENIYDVLTTAISGFHVQILSVVAEGDMVVIRWQAGGVLTGKLFDVGPTNEEFRFSGISWARVADGKIVENWNNWSMSYLFRQLLSEVKALRGILPLCSFCKKIRDDHGYWEQVDVYIHKYSEADVSHGLCPECVREHYPEYAPSSSDETDE